MRSLIGADLPRPFIVLDQVGYDVADARNAIASAALGDPEVTHLLWIDDDATFPSDAVKRLLAHRLPIVGGLCFGRRPPYPPILLHEDPKSEIGYRFQYEYPEGLVEVDATGCHFLLVKRQVFEDVYKRCTTPREGPFTQRGFGEDVSFCQRARECGYRIMVDASVKIGHLGEVNVDETFAKRNRAYLLNEWKRE